MKDGARPRGTHGHASLAGGALAGLGAGFLGWWTLVTFFSPRLNYRMRATIPPDSEEFSRFLELTCPARRSEGNRIDILVDGDAFYPAMLEGIQGAKRSITLEAYVFKPGRVADAFVAALTARARAGVHVSAVLDSAGSFSARGDHVRRLREAGCHVAFYDPVTWNLADRLNNRTHRELRTSTTVRSS